jgi:trehalose synthase
MLERVPVPAGYQLVDYARYAGLSIEVDALRLAAAAAAPALRGRTVWHLNSTSEGGGVAEMLPRVVSLLRQAGIRTEWVVIRPEDPRFFPLTKQLHNMVHGRGASALDAESRALYVSVSRELAAELAPWLAPDDVLVVHDPQPLAVGAILKRQLGLRAVWRCHIGLDRATPTTEAAWDFLGPWAEVYDRVVFSLSGYVPGRLAERATVIHPAIDPLSHKNRDLSVHKLTGVLSSAGMVLSPHPTMAEGFAHPALRLQPDGGYLPACQNEDLGLLFRPCVVQVSRWDRLKGFLPLLEAFKRLKTGDLAPAGTPRERRQREIVRLVLAGPDPAGVRDDPEAHAVLEDLSAVWRAMPPALRADVAILKLPLTSRKENALMVNALQRCASVVVQNSLEEGFGLTVTEAMWKARPVLGSGAAGIRAQVRDGVEGRLVADPEDRFALATLLAEMLRDPKAREVWGFNARYRVSAEFHLLRKVTAWLALYRGLF